MCDSTSFLSVEIFCSNRQIAIRENRLDRQKRNLKKKNNNNTDECFVDCVVKLQQNPQPYQTYQKFIIFTSEYDQMIEW